mgnify:CR=1 FL=1
MLHDTRLLSSEYTLNWEIHLMGIFPSSKSQNRIMQGSVIWGILSRCRHSIALYGLYICVSCILPAPQKKASHKNWCKLHITETHTEQLSVEPPTSTEDPHVKFFNGVTKPMNILYYILLCLLRNLMEQTLLDYS